MRKMRVRLVSLILIIAMCFSATIVTAAEEGSAADDSNRSRSVQTISEKYYSAENASGNSAAAGKKSGSKVKLSAKKLTIRANKSKTLKLRGVTKPVKWSVTGKKENGKKLVTIKTKGKLKQTAVLKAGKRTGSCYVRAKVGKKVYKCKVTVKKKASGSSSRLFPDDDDFQQLKLSKSSENQTASFKAKSTVAKSADSTFVNAVANTSVRLLQETLKEDHTKDNLLISPDSILTALSVMENGSAGKTLSEFKRLFGGMKAKDLSQYLSTMHSRITGARFVTYQIANAIWYKKGSIQLKKPFLQRIVNYYNAEVYGAPFNTGTVKDINNWCYNKTKGKIPSILDRLAPDMRTIVLNAIYFKGSWAEPYGRTVKRDFKKEDGTKQRVDMLEGTEDTYLKVGGADGFVKYYTGGELAFVGLLPPEGMSVDDYIAGLRGSDFIKGYKNRKDSDIDVHTRMPEFSYDYTASLEKPLQNMGLRLAFTGNADFRRISDEPLCIDQIMHKTHIELNKEGTEAAAVTAVLVKAGAAFPIEPRKEKYVYLDRPFVYAIIDTETGLPLFIGAVRSVK